jgi:hypothetical protein
MSKEPIDAMKDVLSEIEIEAADENREIADNQLNSEVENKRPQETISDDERDEREIEKRKEKHMRHRGEVVRARQEKEQMAQMLARKDQEIAYLNQELRRNSSQQIADKEHKLVLESEYAKAALVQAREDGDTDKEADAIRILGRIAAQEAKLETQVADNQREVAPVYDYQPQYQEPILDAESEEKRSAAEEWVSENDWFDEDSRNFDPELRAEALDIDGKFSKSLRLQGDGNLVGTREYYNQLSEIMKKRYFGSNDAKGTDSVRSEPKRSGHVAPVTQGASSFVPSLKRSSNGKPIVSLPQEARDFIAKLDIGRGLTEQQKMAKYSEAFYKLNRG